MIQPPSILWCHFLPPSLWLLTFQLHWIFFFNFFAGEGVLHVIFSCGVWDLVPWPGIEPRPPALGVWSLSRWTTREVLCPAGLLLLPQGLCTCCFSRCSPTRYQGLPPSLHSGSTVTSSEWPSWTTVPLPCLSLSSLPALFFLSQVKWYFHLFPCLLLVRFLRGQAFCFAHSAHKYIYLSAYTSTYI